MMLLKYSSLAVFLGLASISNAQNLVTNGDFSNGTNDWLLNGSYGVSALYGQSALTTHPNGLAQLGGAAYQTITLIPNAAYEVSFDVGVTYDFSDSSELKGQLSAPVENYRGLPVEKYRTMPLELCTTLGFE